MEATAGVVDARSWMSRRTLVRAGAALLVLWVMWAFAQEAWAANRLAAQASSLRRSNAALSAQNADYERDIATVRSGAAAEEVARSNGYSKAGERVYVVASPAAAAPAVAAPPVRVQQASPSIGDALRAWLGALVGQHG